MKGFLRFLILVIVVAIIVGLTYFLLLKNDEYKAENPEPTTSVTPTTNTTNKVEKVKVEKTNEELIKEADEIESQNVMSNEIRSFEDTFGVDLIGSDYKDYFIVMDVDKTNVTVQCAGTMIHVIPYSDFLDSMEYHFDIKGNLVLFVIEQSGLGNKYKFYIKDDSIIKEDYVLEDANYYSGDNSGEISSLPTTKQIDLSEVKQIARKLYEKYVLIND